MNRLLARIRQPEAPPPWGVALIFGLALANFVLVLAVSAALVALFGATTRPFFPLTLAHLLTFILIGQVNRTPERRRALRLGADTRLPLVLLIVLNIGFAALVDLVFAALRGTFTLHPALLGLFALRRDAGIWLDAGVLMLLARPLAEATLFFGVGLPALRARFGVWAGVFGAALLYGAYCTLLYTGALTAPEAALWIFATFALEGVVFALVRAATGSTRAAIVAHAVFGAFALVKAYLILS